MRRRTRRWIAVVIALAGALTHTPAQAATPPEWDALAREIAEPYPALINSSGGFPDYVQPVDSGNPRPMLGYALLQAGLREGRTEWIDAGLRTLTRTARLINPKDKVGVFHLFAMASAYNLAREHLPDHPRFRAGRESWERWLKRNPLRFLPNTRQYANKYVVEAVAMLELQRTGLTSTVRGSALAQPRRSARLARALVNDVAPGAASAAGTRFAGGSAFVLSDPSNNALAYHALSFGFLARAIELMGPGASPQARNALQGVARASWGFQAPDGDLSYIGRSQGMAWTLSLSAYGAEVAGAAGGPDWGPRFRAVSQRAVDRLATRYGVGPHGLWISPSREGGIAAAGRGLDTYASGPTYAGLTLIGLNWAVEHARRHERVVGRIAADDPGSRRLAGGRTEFSVGRSGNSWYAVRTARSFRGRDLRYDVGLIALKRPAPDGGWVDVVRPRPRTTGSGDSAGPVLSGPQGVALPDAGRADVDDGGTMTLRGGYRASDGRWLRRGVSFRYGPVPCGVQIVLPRRPEDRLSYSVWFTDTPVRDGDTLTGPNARVTATPAHQVVLRDGGSSAVDGRLVRADLRFRPGRGPVRITVCGR